MIAYRHQDGRGCVWNGNLDDLTRKDFVDKIFGDIRNLISGERINPQTGEIEPVPPTQEEIRWKADKLAATSLRQKLKYGTITDVDRAQWSDILLRNAHRIGLADLE